MIRSIFRGFLLFAALTLPAQAGEIISSVDATALPEKKITPLGLYLTPADAHAALVDNPGVVFLDGRDRIEISFIGHATGIDAIVPLLISTLNFDSKRGAYVMQANPNFVTQVGAIMTREGKSKSDPVFVTCRSGGRSAAGARMLIEAGYTNVWSLAEGFEGDKNPDTGQRDRNGWRNAGLSWSYKLDARIAWQPAGG